VLQIAQIRYFAWLGGIGAKVIEVTDLRYANDQRVQVYTTRPVNELGVSATILTPEAWCFGCPVTPTYLK
jgi:hypothetical protein